MIEEQERDLIEENENLRKAVERLLVYLTLHEQQHPEWNGNRFDDERFARHVLGEE